MVWWKFILEKIKQFVIDTLDELKKCTWPTGRQLISTTIIVLLVVIFLSVFIVISDFLSQGFIKIFLGI